MEAYYAICAGLATLSLVFLSIVNILTLVQVKNTAERVEVLAAHVDERVEQLRGLGEVVHHLTKTVRSGWMRGAELAFGLFSAFRSSRSEAPRAEEESARERS